MSDTILQDVQALPIHYAPLGHAAPLTLSLTQLLELADGMDNAPAATPLRAFWVGDIDVFAASSAEAALASARRPDDEFDALELDDVREVTTEDLNKWIFDEDRKYCGTLAEALAAATEPGWLMGFE